MNGIECEAIYLRVSRDLGGIPFRNFYFSVACHADHEKRSSAPPRPRG
jgi:hypothetical protein